MIVTNWKYKKQMLKLWPIKKYNSNYLTYWVGTWKPCNICALKLVLWISLIRTLREIIQPEKDVLPAKYMLFEHVYSFANYESKVQNNELRSILCKHVPLCTCKLKVSSFTDIKQICCTAYISKLHQTNIFSSYNFRL